MKTPSDRFEEWLNSRPKELSLPEDCFPLGTVIGPYRIVGLLGRGGFAAVYKAVDDTGQEVSIKVLHALDEKSRGRFGREYQILSKLNGANVEKLIAWGEHEGRPYLVCELLHDCPLPCCDDKVATYLQKICSAVGALHALGYVHRDIKPANVLWRGIEPVLIDYGLACPMSEESEPNSDLSMADGHRIVVGTAGYAAPEQFTGGAIGSSADVYALGMLANACFDGNPPRAWAKIIGRAANSIVSQRYASTDDFVAAIRRRHRGRNVLCLALGLSFIIASVIMGFSMRRDARFDRFVETSGRVAPADRSFSIDRYSDSDLFPTHDVGITGWVMGEKIDPLSEHGLDEGAFHSIVTIIRQQFDGDFDSYIYNQTNVLASQKARITYAKEEVPGSVFAVEIEDFIEGRGKFHIYRKAYRSGNLIYLVMGADLMHLWPEHGRALKSCVDSFRCRGDFCKKVDAERQ